MDVFSFAIVLWEIAHRAMPYADEPDMFVIMRGVVAGLRPTPAEHADVPPAYSLVRASTYTGRLRTR